ncbi:MAG: rhodanese-related sulfurtransferase [Natronomonas sp.]|jgi:rhodanese-related sulfurtransferase
MDGEISGPELEAKLDSDDRPLIVDIRNARQFERLRIPDSVNIPLAELPQRVETLRGADCVVTVCPHGQASVKAARLITSFEGFDGTVESLSCGLSGWDGPVEGEDVTAETGEEAPF